MMAVADYHLFITLESLSPFTSSTYPSDSLCECEYRRLLVSLAERSETTLVIDFQSLQR